MEQGGKGGVVLGVSKTNTNPCSYPVPADLRGEERKEEKKRKGSGRREKQEKGDQKKKRKYLVDKSRRNCPRQRGDESKTATEKEVDSWC